VLFVRIGSRMRHARIAGARMGLNSLLQKMNKIYLPIISRVKNEHLLVLLYNPTTTLQN